MSQKTGFPISLDKYPVDNEYTRMYDAARDLGYPIDWLVRTSRDSYSTVYDLIVANKDDPAYGGDLATCVSTIYFSLFKETGYVSRDMMLYGVIEFVENHFDEREFEETIIDVMRSFESISNLSQTLTLDSDVNIIRADMVRRYDLSLRDTERVTKIISLYRKNCKIADDQVGVLNTGKYEITMNTIEIGVENVTAASGMYIFDNLVMSERFVYANYMDGQRKNYYKLFRGSELDKDPVYDVSKLNKKRNNRPNRLQFGMWLGTGTIYNTTQQSFYAGVLNLETGTIKYKVPVVVRGYDTKYTALSQKVLKEAFSAIFAATSVSFSRGATTGHTVEVNMYPNVNYGIKFDIVVFLHQIMMSDMYRHTFYMEESVRPYAKKRRLEFYYVPFLSEMFKFSSDDGRPVPVKWSLTRKKFYSEPPPEVLYTDPENVPPYFRVRISNAASIKDVEMIIATVSRAIKMHVDVLVAERVNLHSYYLSLMENGDVERGEEMSEMLGRMVFSSKEDEENDITKLSSSREGAARILRLNKHETYGKVFGDGYRADCPNACAPVVFGTLEEAEQWKESATWRISPLQFPAPPEEPLFWFSGSSRDFPYPNIVENTDATTLQSYYYVPKCSSHDPTKGPRTSLYNKVYLGSTAAQRVTGVEKVTDKLLGAREEGKLPLLIERALEAANRIKLGVVNANNPNSFIHCLMYATMDEGYMSRYDLSWEKKTTSESLTRYVEAFRRNLANDASMINVVRQELFDLSDAEISRRIKDVSSYFDPFIYYRLLEEAFGVNIVTFSNVGLFGAEDAKLEVPRHNMVYSRPHRNERRTVIVFKNRGPVRLSKRTPYAHCELIISRTESLAESSFPTSDIQHFVSERILSNVTVTPMKGGSVSVYNSMYGVNYEKMFRKSLLSQKIDSYGHVRAFNILLAPSTKVTVYVPPTQPLKLPLSNEINRITHKEALAFVGSTPSSCSVTKENGQAFMDGLWFSYIGVDCFLYVPIVMSRKISYKKGPNDPAMKEKGISITGRLHRLSKTVDILKQVFVWALDTHRGSLVDDPLNEDIKVVDDFIRDYVSPVSAGVKETLGFYDECSLEQRFPHVSDATGCMKYLRGKCPSLVNEALMFVMVNDRFLERMLYFVRDYFLRTFRGDFVPKQIISDYYTVHTDFRQQNGVEVFVGREELDEWLLFKKGGSQGTLKVYHSINLRMHKTVDPFLLDDGGILSMVQNVEGNDERTSLLRAINVALEWRTSGTNRGYLSPKFSGDLGDVNLALYGITSGDSLAVIQEPKDADVEHINIIIYAGVSDLGERTNIRYAAILDL